MIDLIGIGKTFYKGQVNETKALNSINLHIEKGAFVVLVGANGSGKSTLLNCIAGSLSVDTGTINVAGTDVTQMADYQRSKWISRVFQNPLHGTAPDLSIYDNFRLAAIRTQSKTIWRHSNTTTKSRIKEAVATLKIGLENKLDTPMGQLSGGQRQALTLLLGTFDNTKVLLLDEPTAALDPKSAAMVLNVAKEVIANHHLTVILVTHNMRHAIELGNRLIYMEGGNVMKDLNEEEKHKLSQQDIYSWF